MTDLTWPQQKEYIIQAITQDGFEESQIQGIYLRKDDTGTIGVDLRNPPAKGEKVQSFYLQEAGERDYDAHSDTLQRINTIITDARDGSIKTTPSTAERRHQESKSKPAPPKSDPPQPSSILDLVHSYVGNDVLEIFGDTGSGKSKFCSEVAHQAIAAGKKVFYLDTERNLTEQDIAALAGCEYKYTPILDEIDRIVQNLPAVDLVIIDSIGFPVLTSYARLSMKQKGDALLKLIAIFGDLKTWAYKNNGVAVVTNQPESEFNKGPNHVFRPFGDKSQFAAKEIWKTNLELRNPTQTKISITAFRSRSKGHGSKIATMTITNSGVEVAT